MVPHAGGCASRCPDFRLFGFSAGQDGFSRIGLRSDRPANEKGLQEGRQAYTRLQTLGYSCTIRQVSIMMKSRVNQGTSVSAAAGGGCACCIGELLDNE